MRMREENIEFEGINVHYLRGGSGLPILMMHGSGPGVSSVGNWAQVLEPLSGQYEILAFDLIGFGGSGRKPREPYFDLDLWLDQARFMLGQFDQQPAGIIAHSLSSILALRLAAADDRIAKVLTTGAAGAPLQLNRYLEAAWTFPKTRNDLRHTLEPLVSDQTKLTDAFLDNRMNVLQSGDYGEYFSRMFSGDKQQYVDALVLSDQTLARVTCDVLMMHGRDDRAVPFRQTTLEVSERLSSADVIVLSHCGHGVAQEQPEKFLAAVTAFFG